MTTGMDDGAPQGYPRKPEWLKVRLPGGPAYNRVRDALEGKGLHSVCREARCPNMTECFDAGTATFLILGNTCTRNCRYCHVAHGVPDSVDVNEPARLAEAVESLNLDYVVITSVTRDDLPDGGAAHFVACIEMIRARRPRGRIEVLIPDFQGDAAALNEIIRARPDVINHNMEVVPSLYPQLRPQGDYGRSITLLQRVHEAGGIVTKSGFMIGFGEDPGDIEGLLADLAAVHCRRVTIGQYQRPTARHWPVAKYYDPDEFAAIRRKALSMGFDHVASGPLVRSSYHAGLEVQN
ncbi:MAG: Lipoyl synthase [Syntrophus sp. SKADARSKE-3]|nr:Lipoyl synthase [Syntrophus sp. SKADARSKE-3]